jgi:hypothetical protein
MRKRAHVCPRTGNFFDKFDLLDKDSQQRVILQLQQKAQENATTQKMSLGEWLDWASAFGDYIHNKYGDFEVSSVDLLEEAREERLNDLMGGR